MIKMNKVTVTKLQMDAIEGCRDEYKASLRTVLDHAELEIFCKEGEPINNMTTEQIVLAWYGHAEVEPDFVDFDEAMRAKLEGKKVNFHPQDFKTIEVNGDLSLSKTRLADYSLNELFISRFTIKGDNQ